jgi:hypothetical protein
LDDGSADKLAFPLSLKNYDDLRDEKLMVPRILVVMNVPKGLENWLDETPHQMAMRKRALWVSLRGQPTVDNSATKTVHLPRVQLFTVESLTSMLLRVGEGGMP